MTGVAIEVDLRSQFGPARDQGERPTCIAFAASDAHAAARPAWVPLSCEYAYFHALRRDGGHPDDGATPNGILGAIRDDGQPPEAQWPYMRTVPADLSRWVPPAKVAPIFRCGSGYRTPSFPGLIAQLDAGTPVLFTMCLSDAFYCPGESGAITANEPPDPARRHALIAVGHGVKDNERMLLIRNSWGVGWGVDGYAWLSEGYLMNKVNVAAEMTEDLTNVSRNTATGKLRSRVA